MNNALITILLGFLEGFVLILSPCIVTILPILLAGSWVGSRKRSLGIIVGFALTFALFAIFARQLVYYSGIDSNVIRYIAYVFLFLLALILLSNSLTEFFNQSTQKVAAWGSSFRMPNRNKSDFWSGIFIGSLVSIVWAPCAGPILAAVIVQIAIQKTNVLSFFTLLAFALGAVFPMFVITLYGFKIKNTFQFFKIHTVLIRKILGLVILLNLGYMLSQEWGFVFPSSMYQNSINQNSIRTARYLEKGLWHPYTAPPLGGITAWINSGPLQLAELKGKVVLIDFWTYSCINCVRTLPYLNEWYKKYHDKGLVIIGVHSPEFNFEKNSLNVKNAVKNHGIKYPVALDNSLVTWQNYSNHYWPAHYLINKKGQVVYEHFGEGEYDLTENNIYFLLGLNQPMSPAASAKTEYSYNVTPETYLGYGRAASESSPVLIHDLIETYHFPIPLNKNAWGLQGTWLVNTDKIVAAGHNTSLKINFHARHVYVVMGSGTKKSIEVALSLNGKPLNGNAGKKVINSRLLVNQYALYEVLVLSKVSSGILELKSENPGLELYTFTFGG